MGGIRVSGDHMQLAAETQYQLRLSKIQKMGGVIIKESPSSTTGWELAARLSEDRGKKIEALYTLEGRVSGCNGSKKKKSPLEVWNWPVSEPEVVADEGMTLPSPEHWIDVAAGDGFTCGVADNGEGFCWGGLAGTDYLQKKLVPSNYAHLTPYKTVVVGISEWRTFACWLGAEDGRATCLGDYDSIHGVYEGPFRQLTAGASHVCGLRFDHHVECWGKDYCGKPVASPTGLFTQIDAGDSTTCGVLLESGAIKCMGLGVDDASILTNDPEPFLRVSVGNEWGGDVFLCAITEAGSVKCAGFEYQQYPGPNLVYVDVSMPHWCTLDGDGGVLCRGIPVDAKWETPTSPLFAVSTGVSHVCGLGPDGAIQCWGNNSAGQLDVPWNPSW